MEINGKRRNCGTVGNASGHVRAQTVIKERAMYTNMLIPTDGSELAGKAVKHGIALAKRIGAKATVLTVFRLFIPSRPTRR
jgi:Universal stress protein family